MDRDLSVNAPLSMDPQSDSDAGYGAAEYGIGIGSPPGTADLGPCLYLGPAGQRCNRRATLDGYCARHQPGKVAAAAKNVGARRAFAFLGILAALWPLLLDIIRAILRLLH